MVPVLVLWRRVKIQNNRANCLTVRPQYETLMLRTIQDQDRLKRGRERNLADIQAEMREQLRLAGEEHQSHIAALPDQLRWIEEV